MTDAPAGNGNKRFEDLQAQVQRMDAKMDSHGAALAEIKALLRERPCVVHDNKIRELELGQVRLATGAQVSVAKVSGMAAVVAAIVSAVGAYFMARGH